MVLAGHVDFKTDPWPKISAPAKACVMGLLNQDISKRWTTREVLQCEWLARPGDTPLDSVVVRRMKQFAQATKLKKMCLMVVGQCLSSDEIAGVSTASKLP